MHEINSIPVYNSFLVCVCVRGGNFAVINSVIPWYIVHQWTTVSFEVVFLSIIYC